MKDLKDSLGEWDRRPLDTGTFWTALVFGLLVGWAIGYLMALLVVS